MYISFIISFSFHLNNYHFHKRSLFTQGYLQTLQTTVQQVSKDRGEVCGEHEAKFGEPKQQSCAYGIKPRDNSNKTAAVSIIRFYLVSALLPDLTSSEIHSLLLPRTGPALVVTPQRTPTASRSSRSGQQPQKVKAGDRIRIKSKKSEGRRKSAFITRAVLVLAH